MGLNRRNACHYTYTRIMEGYHTIIAHTNQIDIKSTIYNIQALLHHSLNGRTITSLLTTLSHPPTSSTRHVWSHISLSGPFRDPDQTYQSLHKQPVRTLWSIHRLSFGVSFMRREPPRPSLSLSSIYTDPDVNSSLSSPHALPFNPFPSPLTSTLTQH